MVVFSLGFNVSEKEAPLIRERLARDEDVLDITREILARTKNALATWVVLGPFSAVPVRHVPSRKETDNSYLQLYSPQRDYSYNLRKLQAHKVGMEVLQGRF